MTATTQQPGARTAWATASGPARQVGMDRGAGHHLHDRRRDRAGQRGRWPPLGGVVVGIMMIMAGVAEIIAAFSVKGWGRAIFWMLLGALYVAAGIIAFDEPVHGGNHAHPVPGHRADGGRHRAHVPRLDMREAGKPWGWVVVSGIISLLLGADDHRQVAVLQPYVLGIFLGIDLIFIGSSWLTIGLALKRRHAV